MPSFVRHGAGDTKSGDNDALKHLLATMDRWVAVGGIFGGRWWQFVAVGGSWG